MISSAEIIKDAIEFGTYNHEEVDKKLIKVLKENLAELLDDGEDSDLKTRVTVLCLVTEVMKDYGKGKDKDRSKEKYKQMFKKATSRVLKSMHEDGKYITYWKPREFIRLYGYREAILEHVTKWYTGKELDADIDSIEYIILEMSDLYNQMLEVDFKGYNDPDKLKILAQYYINEAKMDLNTLLGNKNFISDGMVGYITENLK
jgi:hypothetical protein